MKESTSIPSDKEREAVRQVRQNLSPEVRARIDDIQARMQAREELRAAECRASEQDFQEIAHTGGVAGREAARKEIQHINQRAAHDRSVLIDEAAQVIREADPEAVRAGGLVERRLGVAGERPNGWFEETLIRAKQQELGDEVVRVKVPKPEATEQHGFSVKRDGKKTTVSVVDADGNVREQVEFNPANAEETESAIKKISKSGIEGLSDPTRCAQLMQAAFMAEFVADGLKAVVNMADPRTSLRMMEELINILTRPAGDISGPLAKWYQDWTNELSGPFGKQCGYLTYWEALRFGLLNGELFSKMSAEDRKRLNDYLLKMLDLIKAEVRRLGHASAPKLSAEELAKLADDELKHAMEHAGSASKLLDDPLIDVKPVAGGGIAGKIDSLFGGTKKDSA